MMKGISRQVVEIADTTNPYFERVFFIVRPQYREASPTLLDNEPHRVVNPATGYPGLRRARRLRMWRRIGFAALGACIGACIALSVLLI